MEVVIFSSPGREQMLEALKHELRNESVYVIDSPETFGREKFWLRWEMARRHLLSTSSDDFLILPDDVCGLDLKAIRDIHKYYKGKLFTVSAINDGRTHCWGSKHNKVNDRKVAGVTLLDLGFFDCGGITNRSTLSKLKVNEVHAQWHQTRTSSGVGHQLTNQLRKIGAKMFIPSPSLCYHGDHDSVMHPEERKKNPLIAVPRLKVVIGIATFGDRGKYLKQVLKSLEGQADVIRIYDNAERDEDLTDNGKFYFLQEYKEPVYYFSVDDDIIYPPTYVKDMINAIEMYSGTAIVTHHGRILKKKGVHYYTGGHTVFRCMMNQPQERVISVAGTGVCAFRTDYFNPVDIWKSEYKKMSDLVFSEEAARQGKRIIVLPHKAGYFKAVDVPKEETIFGTHVTSPCLEQSALADSILSLLPSLSS